MLPAPLTRFRDRVGVGSGPASGLISDSADAARAVLRGDSQGPMQVYQGCGMLDLGSPVITADAKPLSAARPCPSFAFTVNVVKNKWSWYAIAALGLFFGWIVGRAVGVLVACAILFVPYLISLWLHPRARHSACNGTGERRGGIFGWTHRRCPDCQSGRIIRFGAAYMGPSNIRNQAQRNRKAAAITKSRQRW